MAVAIRNGESAQVGLRFPRLPGLDDSLWPSDGTADVEPWDNRTAVVLVKKNYDRCKIEVWMIGNWRMNNDDVFIIIYMFI